MLECSQYGMSLVVPHCPIDGRRVAKAMGTIPSATVLSGKCCQLLATMPWRLSVLVWRRCRVAVELLLGTAGASSVCNTPVAPDPDHDVVLCVVSLLEQSVVCQTSLSRL